MEEKPQQLSLRIKSKSVGLASESSSKQKVVSNTTSKQQQTWLFRCVLLCGVLGVLGCSSYVTLMKYYLTPRFESLVEENKQLRRQISLLHKNLNNVTRLADSRLEMVSILQKQLHRHQQKLIISSLLNSQKKIHEKVLQRMKVLKRKAAKQQQQAIRTTTTTTTATTEQEEEMLLKAVANSLAQEEFEFGSVFYFLVLVGSLIAFVSHRIYSFVQIEVLQEEEEHQENAMKVMDQQQQQPQSQYYQQLLQYQQQQQQQLPQQQNADDQHFHETSLKYVHPSSFNSLVV